MEKPELVKEEAADRELYEARVASGETPSFEPQYDNPYKLDPQDPK